MDKPKAFSCIQVTVLDFLLLKIIYCNTAKKTWDKLKQEFGESKNRGRSSNDNFFPSRV